MQCTGCTSATRSSAAGSTTHPNEWPASVCMGGLVGGACGDLSDRRAVREELDLGLAKRVNGRAPRTQAHSKRRALVACHCSRASTAYQGLSGCQRKSDRRDAVTRLCKGIAAVHTRDSANDCQSQTVMVGRTRSGGIAAPESLEHSPWLGNRWTDVADRDPGYAIETLHLNGNGRTRRRVASRV